MYLSFGSTVPRRDRSRHASYTSTPNAELHTFKLYQGSLPGHLHYLRRDANGALQAQRVHGGNVTGLLSDMCGDIGSYNYSRLYPLVLVGGPLVEHLGPLLVGMAGTEAPTRPEGRSGGSFERAAAAVEVGVFCVAPVWRQASIGRGFWGLLERSLLHEVYPAAPVVVSLSATFDPGSFRSDLVQEKKEFDAEGHVARVSWNDTAALAQLTGGSVGFWRSMGFRALHGSRIFGLIMTKWIAENAEAQVPPDEFTLPGPALAGFEAVHGRQLRIEGALDEHRQAENERRQVPLPVGKEAEQQPVPPTPPPLAGRTWAELGSVDQMLLLRRYLMALPADQRSCLSDDTDGELLRLRRALLAGRRGNSEPLAVEYDDETGRVTGARDVDVRIQACLAERQMRQKEEEADEENERPERTASDDEDQSEQEEEEHVRGRRGARQRQRDRSRSP